MCGLLYPYRVGTERHNCIVPADGAISLLFKVLQKIPSATFNSMKCFGFNMNTTRH